MWETEGHDGDPGLVVLTALTNKAWLRGRSTSTLAPSSCFDCFDCENEESVGELCLNPSRNCRVVFSIYYRPCVQNSVRHRLYLVDNLRNHEDTILLLNFAWQQPLFEYFGNHIWLVKWLIYINIIAWFNLESDIHNYMYDLYACVCTVHTAKVKMCVLCKIKCGANQTQLTLWVQQGMNAITHWAEYSKHRV